MNLNLLNLTQVIFSVNIDLAEKSTWIRKTCIFSSSNMFYQLKLFKNYFLLCDTVEI